MSMQVPAIYEHGILRLLEPVNLAENERVVLTITPVHPAAPSDQPDHHYAEALRARLNQAGPPPGWEEVRRRLSTIPGTLTGDFIAEREDH